MRELSAGLNPESAYSDDFRRFQERYRLEPAAFVVDCFHWGGDRPAPYQISTLEALISAVRLAIRGPHGLGKTAEAAWLALWFSLTREGQDWKVVTTASVWRQLDKYLWPEIHKWSRRLRWERIGRRPFDERRELLERELKLTTGEAFAVASDKADLIEGAHAERLLYLLDEAKGIPDDTWDAVEGAFSGAGPDTPAEAYAFAFSTPGEPAGRFYQIHARAAGYEDWKAIHVSRDQAIKAGRMSRKWAEQRRRQWGAKSAIYQNRVLGEFASSEEDGVIPLAWVEASNERWARWSDAGKPGKRKAVGVDVARGGKDETVFAIELDVDEKKIPDVKIAVDDLRAHRREDTMKTAGRVVGLLRKDRSSAVIDIVGIGAGVFDRVRELEEFSVLPHVASEATDRRERSGELGFADKRSAGWWAVREMLDPANAYGVALPADEKLTADLVAPRYKLMSGGKIRVESKDELRKPSRLGRSTDRGDAVMMVLDWRYSVAASRLLLSQEDYSE